MKVRIGVIRAIPVNESLELKRTTRFTLEFNPNVQRNLNPFNNKLGVKGDFVGRLFLGVYLKLLCLSLRNEALGSININLY